MTIDSWVGWPNWDHPVFIRNAGVSRRYPQSLHDLPGGFAFQDAPQDGYAYARRNGVWERVVRLAGDRMQGRLYMRYDPEDPLETVPLRTLEERLQVIDGGKY